MTIEQLKVFLCIAQTNSFSETAEELFIGQSSVSKKVQALEEELGVVLFARKARKVELTKGGQAFYTYATSMIDTYNQMLQGMKPFVSTENRDFKVTSLALLSSYSLLAPLKTFVSETLKSNLNVIERIFARDVLHDYHSGEYSVCILFEDFLDQQSMEFIPILEDQFVCAFHKHHWLAKHESVSLDMLKKEKFVLPLNGEFYKERMIERCKQYKFIPDLMLMDLRFNTIMDAVAAGEYITVCYKQSIVSQANDRLLFRELSDMQQVRFGFAFDAGQAAADRINVDQLRNFPQFYRSMLRLEAAKNTWTADF